MAEKRKEKIVENMQNTGKLKLFEYLFEDSKKRLALNQTYNSRRNDYISIPQRNSSMKKHNVLSSPKSKRLSTDVDELNHNSFRPATGRAPSNERNTEHLPIYEYLYRKSRNSEHNDKMIVQTFRQCTNPKSTDIVEKAKEEAFMRIFMIIDKDKDSVIIPRQDLIDDEIPACISKMLSAKKEYEVTLDKYMKYCQILFKTLNPEEKRKILKPANKYHTAVERRFSYAPVINKSSREIAKQKRSQYQTVADMWKKQAEKTENKILKARADRSTNEVAECTFQPMIINK